MKFISAQIQIGSVCKTGNVVCSLTNRLMFSSYRKKDSRNAMEQNVGPTTAGDQKSGWLNSQTNSLRQLGAKLTYSGDSPCLLRLVIGVTNEQSSDTASWLPLHVPFRKELAKTSLVSIEDISCICPDATHMITRCVETDLRKMAQKIR